MIDIAKPKGVFDLYLINKHTGKIEQHIHKDNLIVASSFDSFYELLANANPDKSIGVIALGDGGISDNNLIPPTSTDTSLLHELYRTNIKQAIKVIDDTEAKTPEENFPYVKFTTKIVSAEGNLGGGTLYNEAGLITKDGKTLFSRVVFESVFKSSDFIINIEWRIIWQYDRSKLQSPYFPLISGKTNILLNENQAPKKLSDIYVKWNGTKDTITFDDPSNSFELKTIDDTHYELWSTKKFDYETMPTYYPLEIKAKNDKGNETLFIAGVSIQDVISGAGEILPTIENATLSFYENNVIGSIVGRVPNNPNSSNYTLTLNDTTNFDINPNGDIITKKVFDFENDTHVYNLVATLKNEIGQVTSNITINLKDIIIGSGEIAPTITVTKVTSRPENSPPHLVQTVNFDGNGNPVTNVKLNMIPEDVGRFELRNITPTSAEVWCTYSFDFENDTTHHTFSIEVSNKIGTSVEYFSYIVTDVVEAVKPILKDQSSYIFYVSDTPGTYNIKIEDDGGEAPSDWEMRVKGQTVSNNTIIESFTSLQFALKPNDGNIEVSFTTPRVYDYYANFCEVGMPKRFRINNITEGGTHNDLVKTDMEVRCKNSAGWSNWATITFNMKNKPIPNFSFASVMRKMNNENDTTLLNLAEVTDMRHAIGRFGYEKDDLKPSSFRRWNTSNVTSIAWFTNFNLTTRMKVKFDAYYWNLNKLNINEPANVFNFVYSDSYNTGDNYNEVSFPKALDMYLNAFRKALGTYKLIGKHISIEAPIVDPNNGTTVDFITDNQGNACQFTNIPNFNNKSFKDIISLSGLYTISNDWKNDLVSSPSVFMGRVQRDAIENAFYKITNMTSANPVEEIYGTYANGGSYPLLYARWYKHIDAQLNLILKDALSNVSTPYAKVGGENCYSRTNMTIGFCLGDDPTVPPALIGRIIVCSPVLLTHERFVITP